MYKLGFSVSFGAEPCPFSGNICPKCSLDASDEVIGKPFATDEYVMGALREGLAFAETAREHGCTLELLIPGREATTSKFLPEALARAHDAGVRVTLATNGTKLGNTALKKVLTTHPPHKLRISLSASNGAGLHQRSVSNPEHTIEKILIDAQTLREIGGCGEVDISTTFLGSDYQEIIKLYFTTRRFQVGGFIVQEHLKLVGNEFKPVPSFADLHNFLTRDLLSSPPQSAVLVETHSDRYLRLLLPDEVFKAHSIDELKRRYLPPFPVIDTPLIGLSGETNVSLVTINDDAPGCVIVRISGELVTLGETRVLPRDTKLGPADPGRVREELYRQMLRVKQQPTIEEYNNGL